MASTPTRRAILAVTPVATLATFGMASPAEGAQTHYNKYTSIGAISTVHDCPSAQAFAAGSTWLYSIKIRSSDDGRAVIYRTNKTTGESHVMTNNDGGREYIAGLEHANDAALVTINGSFHMFIVTVNSAGPQLIKLHYSGNKYRQVGTYDVVLDGDPLSVSGISKVAVSDDEITFLLKNKQTYYKGTLAADASSGAIQATPLFDITRKGALVNGNEVPDLDSFSNQGIHYHVAGKRLYVPVTKGNRSIVLAFSGVTMSTTGTLTADQELSFRITSATYKDLFEIEGVGTSGDRLYFNTNRRKTSGDSNWDGVHVFDAYAAN